MTNAAAVDVRSAFRVSVEIDSMSGATGRRCLNSRGGVRGEDNVVARVEGQDGINGRVQQYCCCG